LSLGHQVVRRVAAVHGGRLDVSDQLDEGTTCYRIVLGEGAALT
jgi:signal transduction histidine kinase